MSQTLTFSISLSGGGARGVLQLGAMQALYEYNIHPQVVAGTSMGAINGVLYCAGHSPATIAAILKEHLKMISFSWLARFRSGFKSFELLRTLLQMYAPPSFEELKYPLYISVTNLNTGRNEIVSSGNRLFDFVIASASIPLVYKPKVIDGIYYVDGGISNNFPALVLQGKADRIIGVHVNHVERVNELPNLVSMLERMYRIAIYSNVWYGIDMCDYFLDPSEAMRYKIFDFDKFDEIYALGYEHGLKFAERIANQESL